ncbi:MAG: helix-hairpin-helix domain-containing protein [Acidobacteriota bacterium]
MENREIAAIFEEISNLMKITQEDPKWSFKAAAYDRARRSLEGFHERAEDLARDPQRKLTEIPGVGEDLAGRKSGCFRRSWGLNPSRISKRP